MVFYYKKMLLFLFVLFCNLGYGIDESVIDEIKNKKIITVDQARDIINEQIGKDYPENHESESFITVKLEDSAGGDNSLRKIYNEDSV